MFSTAEKTAKPSSPLQRKAEGTSFFGKTATAEPATVSAPFFAPARVQPKLNVSTPGDRYETEADAVADRVMRMPEPVAAPVAPAERPAAELRLDRQADKEEEETVQAKNENLTISRLPEEEPEEKAVQPKRSTFVQRQEDTGGFDYDAGPDTYVQPFVNRTNLGLHRSDVVQRSGRGSPSASQTFEQSLQSNAGGGRPLPEPTRAFMETRFGADFSGVRIHTDASAQEMSRDIHAQAFTHGNHIYFNSGKFDPDSSAGRTLIAHELTHTVQQGASPVAPSVAPKHQFTAVQTKAIQRVAQLDQAVTIAKGEEGKVNANAEGPDGYRQGWDRLSEYFRTAMGADKVVSGSGGGGYQEGTVAEDQIKKKSLYLGQVANQPPTVRAERDAMPSWCGIFVFWALNKGGVPMPKWTLGGRAVTPESAYPPGRTPQAGDIAYRNANSHYALVEKATGSDSSATITTVNGNTAGEDNLGGQIQTRDHAMSQWDGFFNPLTLMEGNLRAARNEDKDTKARSLKELRKTKFNVQRKETREPETTGKEAETLQARPELSPWTVSPQGLLQRAEEAPQEQETEEIQRTADTPQTEFTVADDEDNTAQRQADPAALIVQTRQEVADRIRQTTPAGLNIVQASWLGDAWDAVSGLAGEIADLVERGLDAAKDWLLEKVRDFVIEIPGYKLLRVILGYDPITGENVERNATNLLVAVLDIIPAGGGVVRRVLDYFNATEPVANWLLSAVDRFIEMIRSIGARFEAFWDSLSLSDVGDPTGVIDRIAALFRGIVSDLVNFVVECGVTFLRMVKEVAITNIVDFVKRRFPNAFELLCIVLGENPITGEPVARTGANILNAGLKALGARGQQIKQQMVSNGIFDRCAAWVDRGIDVVVQTVVDIKNAFVNIWNNLSFDSLLHPIDTFEMIVDQFRRPVTRVVDFLTDAAIELLTILKDALLGRLSAFARETRGYTLITVILGRDPFTGRDVERNTENIIHGFMSLMEGGEEQFRQMKESGAIDRMSQKVTAALRALNFTWGYIVGLFTSLWNSMDWTDFLNPFAAFRRIIGTFAQPVRRLIAFVAEIIKIVIEVLMVVMNFPIDVVMSIINKVMGLIDTIKRDPVGFLKNLLRAIKQGFIQFFENILPHLLGGLADWFFHQLGDLGIQRPPDLSLGSILKLVMQVLGISLERIMEKVWRKLAERIGQDKVDKIRRNLARLEGIWRFIRDVMERGPAAIWEFVQEKLSNLWQVVIDAAQNWIMDKVIGAVVSKLLSMLDPTGIMAVVNSVIAVYRAVQSAIEYLRQMLEIVNSFVNGVAEIAAGNIKVAADFLERTAAQGIPVMIGFLANQVGLGRIAAKLAEIIGTIREKVDQAIDWLVEKALTIGRPIIDGIVGLIERGEALVERGRQAVNNFIQRLLGIRKPFTDSEGESHNLYFVGSGPTAELMVASNPRTINGLLKAVQDDMDDPKVKKHKNTYDLAVTDNARINTLKQKLENSANPNAQKDHEELIGKLNDIAPRLAILMPLVGATEPPPLLKPAFANGVKGTSFTVHYLKKGRTSGGSPANANSGASLAGWPRINSSGLSANSAWVKMHLLTEQLGGPALDSNLTPARGTETNLYFYREVEKHAIDAVADDKVIWYDVTVGYHGTPNNDYINLIKMEFGPYEYDKKTKAWAKRPMGHQVDNVPVGKTQSQSPLPPDFSGAPTLVDLNSPLNGRVKIENLAPGLDRPFAEFVVQVRSAVGSFSSKTNLKNQLIAYYNTERVYELADFRAKVNALYDNHMKTYELL